MKQLMFFGMIALVLAISSACDSNHETTSNAGPDRTSLPDAHGPANGSYTNSNSNSNDANSTAGMQDNFWSEAAIGGMAEVEMGKLASSKAQNAEVKRFGEMMVTDHSKANDELKAIASRKNLTLPTGLDAEHISTSQRLKSASGADFDRLYVEEMVEDHQADVEMFEQQSESGTDPDAKAFAAKTLPTLRKHLDAIKNIQAKMK